MSTFPHLYKRRKDGKLHKWIVWAENDMLWKQDHLVGGKKKKPTGKFCNGTNIGKKNEKSPQEQAVAEANRTWVKMLDKGYKPDPSDEEGQKLYNQVMTAKSQAGFKNHEIMEKARNITVSHPHNKRFFPMLAMNWEKKKTKINLKNGAYIQPKVDGIRCLARLENGNVILTSRTGKEFSHFQHIKQALKRLLYHSNIILDGELYTHSLKENNRILDKTERWELISGICSISRKIPHEKENLISFYVFDIYDVRDKFTQEERFDALAEIFEKWNSGSVIKLSTLEIHNEEEIMKLHDKWVEESYEGVIIRDKNAKYLPGPTKRSEYLLKYKIFDTDEFTIVDAKEGKSTEKGCVIWICETKEGKHFSCRPKGNKKQRELWWKNQVDFLGKDLTVKYQGMDPITKTPRFPVGIDLDRWSKE